MTHTLEEIKSGSDPLVRILESGIMKKATKQIFYAKMSAKYMKKELRKTRKHTDKEVNIHTKI